MKRVFSVILLALFLLGSLPFAASAEIVGSGECGADGNNVVWTLDGEGTLTLTGSGRMNNYSWNEAPPYRSLPVKALKVEEGVTSLGDYAFYNCTSLAEVSLPESLTSVGGYAFCGCAEIPGLVLPEAVTAIGGGAFYGCEALAEINLPAGVTSVESYAFCGCASLPSVVLPEATVSIGGAAFSGCASLRELELPQGVETIGNSAFYGCKSLKEIVLPDSVSSVGKRAFSDCTALRVAVFGSGLTAIAEEMFTGCKSLTELTLPEGIASVGKGAFSGCAGLTSVAFPKKLSVIEDDAFSGCVGLTSLSLPAGLTSVGASAFAQCAGLGELTLPSTLTEVGAAAFDGCLRLTGVVVPPETARIGEDAFPAQAVLYGKAGSSAADWAQDNDRAFTPQGEVSLTLTGPSVVSDRYVSVCGFATPGVYVTCGADGKDLLTVTASASGKWNAKLPLDDAADGSVVTVRASVTGDTTVTRELPVEYRSAAPAFRELTLEHNFYTVTVTEDDLNTPKSNVTLAPDQPFSFRVKVSNSDRVRKLYVVSTKKSEVKMLELFYDEASGCWLGDGFFDEADHAYVPGTLSVEGRTVNGSGFKAGVSVKINFLKDPAGFAYEAVRSNHVAGVTAAVYYKDADGHELLWNAAAAEQFNPATTLPDGAFSWAVTRGTWQIRLSKDGYETAATDWMTVPPAQDQVLLPMVTTRAPQVESLNVYADRAEIAFDSYMEISSVNGGAVAFDGYEGTVEAVDAEETGEGSGVFYAKTFRFVPEEPFAGEVSVTVSGAKNYAGIEMASAYAASLPVSGEPGVFTATDAVELLYGDSAEITVSAENAAGKTVTVIRGGNIARLSAETLTLDETGSAKLTVSGLMTGSERITFRLDGASLTAATEVKITIPRPRYPGDVDADGFVTPGDARQALRISVRLEDCEEGSDAFLAADVNHDGTVGPDDARLILRASVGLETLTEAEPEPAS